MTNGECSKCGSSSVYAIETYGHQRGILLSFWSTKVAVITYLICTKCGYVESYIFDKNSLAEIEQKGMYIESKRVSENLKE